MSLDVIDLSNFYGTAARRGRAPPRRAEDPQPLERCDGPAGRRHRLRRALSVGLSRRGRARPGADAGNAGRAGMAARRAVRSGAGRGNRIAAAAMPRSTGRSPCTFSRRPNSALETLREIWRILAPGGTMLLIAPNRRGVWARSDATPFGHGRPFSRGQLTQLLRDALFAPIGWSEALYMPPVIAAGCCARGRVGARRRQAGAALRRRPYRRGVEAGFPADPGAHPPPGGTALQAGADSEFGGTGGE